MTRKNLNTAIMTYALRCDQSEKRKQHTSAKKVRKASKSSFVRFFESLQNRCELSIHGLHESWTGQVRKEMEEAETWPTGMIECDLKIVAEYVSRLQRAFWQEVPELKWYEVEIVRYWEELRPYLKILKKIYRKIRNKGMRDKLFQMPRWNPEHSPSLSMVYPCENRYREDAVITITPFTPYCDHGGGI